MIVTVSQCHVELGAVVAWIRAIKQIDPFALYLRVDGAWDLESVKSRGSAY